LQLKRTISVKGIGREEREGKESEGMGGRGKMREYWRKEQERQRGKETETTLDVVQCTA